jgi:hypothetical protein
MNNWLAPGVAEAQRALADEQLQQQSPLPIQFCALADAVRFTQCPGDLWEVGCGSGYNREALDRQGVAYRSYGGNDISPAAIKIARERYPEGAWEMGALHGGGTTADVIVDGCSLMHADDWRQHLADLCARSRRWVILHRVPLRRDYTQRTETQGYGQTFGAWGFMFDDLQREMAIHGFDAGNWNPWVADGDSVSLVFARPRIFCTYADSAYLGRLKAMHASMKRHCGPFELHVLAWDEGVAAWCETEGLPCRISAGDSSAWPGPPRSKVETMWTVGPQWIADVMKRTGQPVTYVDADVMFHSSPEPVFAEIGGAPAAVFPHGFARASQGLPGPTAESHEVFGKYNVGLVYVADPAIAEEWAAQCREWCYDRLSDDGTYGDQAYLTEWPAKHGAHVVQHPGAQLGPWAVHTRSLDVRDGMIHFGGRPLVAFHYSAYRELPDGHTVMTRPEYRLTPRQEDIIYGPYIDELRRQR